VGKGTAGGAEVRRDAWGVPHVRADDELGLAGAQGRVTAHDRTWQLRLLRAQVVGASAALLGPAGLAWDVLARRVRLADTARRAYAALADDDRAWVDAYAAGVREGLAAAGPTAEERELDRLDERPAEPAEVVLALGSNLGSSQDVLRSAVAALAAVPGLEVHEVSPLARTSAVGGPAGQPDFLNAVVLARTTLAPRELLLAVQEIENEHGRVREERWGPRTLDIDIIQFENVIAFSEDLELPHPRAHERAFVLQPWAELDPQAVLAGLGGGPVEALAATAPDKDGLRWMALDWLSPRES